MTTVTLKGTPITVSGKFLAPGDYAPSFTLTQNDLQDISLENFDQRFLILNIFPSLDTSTCALSVKHFNSAAADLPDCKILCISKDLPFASSRFCEANNTNVVTTLSAFRATEFAAQYGVNIKDGPLRGLLARAIIILNDERQVIYSQLVSEITHEPDYDKCLSIVANYDN